MGSACSWLGGAVGALSIACAAPAVDGSLPAAEYARAGVPAADRRWSAEDMAAAAKALAAVARKSPGRLPRHDSPRSGALFARLIATDNLDDYRRRATPLDRRMGPALDFQAAADTVLNLYLSCAATEGGYRREVVEVTGLVLRTTVVVLDLMNELMPTLREDDPTYPTRMQGAERARAGIATAVVGTLGMLDDESLGEHGRRLVAIMEERFPSILRRLPAPHRDRLLALVETRADHRAVKRLHPELRRLRDTLRAALRDAR